MDDDSFWETIENLLKVLTIVDNLFSKVEKFHSTLLRKVAHEGIDYLIKDDMGWEGFVPVFYFEAVLVLEIIADCSTSPCK